MSTSYLSNGLFLKPETLKIVYLIREGNDYMDYDSDQQDFTMFSPCINSNDIDYVGEKKTKKCCKAKFQ